MTDLLRRLKKANASRCPHYGHFIEDWTPTDWACAVAGEVGELCNFIKKAKRGDDILLKDIAKEAADVIIYLDILCQRLGIDLHDAIVSKFNESSAKLKVDITLEPDNPIKYLYELYGKDHSGKRVFNNVIIFIGPVASGKTYAIDSFFEKYAFTPKEIYSTYSWNPAKPIKASARVIYIDGIVLPPYFTTIVNDFPKDILVVVEAQGTKADIPLEIIDRCTIVECNYHNPSIKTYEII